MRYILLILLLTSLVYAQDSSIITKKDTYSQNEMFQAEIFIEDIKQHEISILNPYGFPSSIGVNLMKLTDNQYFIYFKIPEVTQGVYTLKIRDKEKQFQITSEKQKLIISPGAIKFTPELSQFSKIIVLNEDVEQKIINIFSSNPVLTASLNEIIIPAKSSKTFNIKLRKPESNILAVLSLNEFNIPVWYIKDEETIPFFEKEVEKIQKIERGLGFYTKSDTQLNYITKEIQESTPVIDSIFLQNHLNETLNNLKLSLTGNLGNIVKLEFTELDSLEPEQKKKLGITVNENRLLYENEYSGNLIITTDKHSFKLSINFIKVERAQEPESLVIEEITESIVTNKTVIEEPEEKPSKAKYIYLLFLIIILAVIGYLIYKKPKAKKTTFKQLIKKAGY